MEPFDLFGGGDIDIVGDRLGVLHPVVEKGGDLDPPAFGFRLYFIFVADAHVARSLGAYAVEFDLAFIAGFGGFGPGLEETDGPQVFVEADLLHAEDKITPK